ncbi:MAG: hypothetical protein E7256_15650 [Lachnospiraceae bacterium]|nr:hypothetical protein [Lachnospiraceae bacterium]
MSKTKIVVVKLKQIIYAGIFAVLGIILIILLISLFKSGSDTTAAVSDTAKYKAGVYTSVIALNGTNLNLEVVVDKDHVNSVRIVNLDEVITTMYPLVEPSINDIAEQLCSDVDIEDITLSEDRKYTSQLLFDAVKATLNKAIVATESAD